MRSFARLLIGLLLSSLQLGMALFLLQRSRAELFESVQLFANIKDASLGIEKYLHGICVGTLGVTVRVRSLFTYPLQAGQLHLVIIQERVVTLAILVPQLAGRIGRREALGM